MKSGEYIFGCVITLTILSTSFVKVTSMTTTFAGGGGTTTLAGGGGTTTLAGGGGTTTLAGGGGTTTLAAGGGTTTLAAGGGTTTLAAGGGTTTLAAPIGTTAAAAPIGTTTATTTAAAAPIGTTNAAGPYFTTAAPPIVTAAAAPPIVTTTAAPIGTTPAAPTAATTTAAAAPTTTQKSSPGQATTTIKCGKGANIGSSYTLSCSITGNITNGIHWFSGETNIIACPINFGCGPIFYNKYSVSTALPTTQHKIEIRSVAAEDIGQEFSCIDQSTTPTNILDSSKCTLAVLEAESDINGGNALSGGKLAGSDINGGNALSGGKLAGIVIGVLFVIFY